MLIKSKVLQSLHIKRETIPFMRGPGGHGGVVQLDRSNREARHESATWLVLDKKKSDIKAMSVLRQLCT